MTTRLLFLCVTFIFLAFAAPNIDSELIASFKATIKSMAIKPPSNAKKLVRSVSTKVFQGSATKIPVANVIKQAKKWGCTGKCATKFHQIAYSAKTGFDTFTFKVHKLAGTLHEFVGAAQNIDGKVDMAYMIAQTSGALIQQTHRVRVKECHHILFVKVCHHKWKTLPRGFTAAELSDIQDDLEATGYKALLKDIDKEKLTMHQDGLNFLRNEVTPLDEESLLDKAIRAMLARIPEIKKSFQNSTFEVITRLVGRGFTYFKQHADVQYVKSVMKHSFDPYVKEMLQILGVPSKLQGDLIHIVNTVKYADSNEWIKFSVIFNTDGKSSARELAIFGRHNPDDTYDFLHAALEVEFEFAPDLYVIRESKSILGGAFGSSKDHIVFRPHHITIKELDEVFAFFNIVMLEKTAFVMHIIDDDGAVIPIEDGENESDGWLNKIIKSITGGSFSELVGMLDKLKTETSSHITNEFRGPDQGFAKLGEDCFVWKINGLVEHKLNDFLTELGEIMNIPKGHKKDWEFVMKLIPYSDEQEWMSYKMLFDMKKGGEAHYAAFMVNHNTTSKKYNFVVANLEASFKLAPDLFVVRKATSVLGGLFSSSKDVIEERPRGITEKDMDFVFDYLTIVQFKRFADLLGIAATNPKPIFNDTRMAYYLTD